MPRADRALSLEEKLDRAVRVFWEKGYYDTSVETLMARSGLNRAAIYGGFGSKQKLFENLLARYRSTHVEGWFVPLSAPNAGLDGIENFFRQFRDLAGPADRFGCLIALTSSEVSPHIRSVERIVSDVLGDLRSLIRAAVMNARKRGEVVPTTDPEFVADYAVGAVLGMWAMIRSPMPRRATNQYLNGVLILLESLRPARAGGD